jgi:PPK2 family polyphosphate:nucleotide phosphotransferase
MESPLFKPVDSPYLVPFDGRFRLADASTSPPDGKSGKNHKKDNQEALAACVERIGKVQRKLYADDRFAVLLVFQAMDAAGKDGTIRAVLSGVNPAGCEVFAFKAPSSEELDHDFLWRSERCLPERGRIGVWNRSHYEEVLVVRVNPRFLDAQKLPRRPEKLDDLWAERYASIRDAEHHWARNGTVVLKFFLHVSKDEQKQRLLERIDDPEVNWKFDAADMAARAQWKDFMRAYEDALGETSRAYAPWYCIPADSKSYMRRAVAEIVADTLEQLDLRWPTLAPDKHAEMVRLRAQLIDD